MEESKMSGQKKTINKFLAATVATTIVATATMVPYEVNASTFKDVGPQYKEGVNFLSGKGISGFSKTEFGVHKGIKRIDAAIMVAKVLNLSIGKAPASGFTDIPKRAEPYINALKAAGVIEGATGTKFLSNRLITRGEVAVMIQRGYNLQGNSQPPFIDVPKHYVEAVSAIYDYGIANGISSTRFGTTQTVKRGDFANLLLKANRANLTVPGEPNVVAIKGAQYLSQTQVEVTFSKVIDNVKPNNFKIDGTTVTAAKLGADKKSAVLTVRGLDFAKYYTVETVDLTVNKVKQPNLAASFQTAGVTDVFEIVITAKDGKVEADKSTTTELTFEVMNKETGKAERNASNIVLELNSTTGTLPRRVITKSGSAKVKLVTPASGIDQIATVSAQVIEAPTAFKVLEQVVRGSADVPINKTTDTTPFQVNNVKGYYSYGSHRIELTFSEGVQLSGGSSDAINSSQYKLNGKALPKNSVITVHDNNQWTADGFEIVRIEFPYDPKLYRESSITINSKLLSYDNTLLTGPATHYFNLW